MVSHIMLFISIQLTSKYVSQRIKMEKAETVDATFSFGSKIAQVPMRSYCHEMLADGGGIFGFARLLRGRCSSMLRLCSPAGFQMGSAGIRCLGEMAGFCKRAFSPAALVVKNGLFLCVEKLPGKCCCFVWMCKTATDLFKRGLDLPTERLARLATPLSSS